MLQHIKRNQGRRVRGEMICTHARLENQKKIQKEKERKRRKKKKGRGESNKSSIQSVQTGKRSKKSEQHPINFNA